MSVNDKKSLNKINKENLKLDKNFKNLKINFVSPEGIEIIDHIYTGKYSNVFEAFDTEKEEFVIVKSFKKTHKRKIKKEIFIIETLKNTANIININKVVKDNCSNTVSLIFDKYEHTPSDILKNYLTKNTLKIYFKELVNSVKTCHAHNVLHRDLRPENFLFNIKSLKGKLIDYGCAVFIKKNVELDPKSGLRFYRAPEKILEQRYYNESSDIWSLGCILLQFISHNEVIFESQNIFEQLKIMIEILGNDKLIKYINSSDIIIDPKIKKYIESKIVQGKGIIKNRLWSKEAWLLVEKILTWNPKQRPTIKEILSHPFFK